MTDRQPDTPAATRAASAVGPVSVRVADGPLVAPVLGRVVSMVLARADCPVDRLDDALILCDAIAAHAPAYSRDGRVSFRLGVEAGAVELRVAELSSGGAARLVEDAGLPDVGNVIERFSDSRRIERAEDGVGEQLVLSLQLTAGG